MATRDTPPQSSSATVPLAPVGRLVGREFRLRVEGGPDEPRVWAFAAERTVIGTHQAADLILSDEAVSRFHSEVLLRNGVARLADLDSRNGTFVDGVRIEAAHLHAGATLLLGQTRLRFEHGDAEVRVPLSDSEAFGRMVGRAPAMRAVFALLERIAPTDTTVLLQGETGTGKDVAARSIHEESRRSAGPFVVLDCGAVPGALLESELLGHERGAFTGADRARPGAAERAHGGTLFLDEIGELPPELQPKLLRVIDRREVQRVGGTTPVPVDIRIIAASNRDLRQEVNRRRFRADLFYRIAVVTVALPPLRERTEDIAFLVDRHVTRLAPAGGEAAAQVRSRKLLLELARHSWPGNVRELHNYVERSLALGADVPRADEDKRFLPAVDPAQPLREARARWNVAFERRYLEALLEAHDGNMAAAARAAGIDRKHLYRLVWRTGLRAKPRRKG